MLVSTDARRMTFVLSVILALFVTFLAAPQSPAQEDPPILDPIPEQPEPSGLASVARRYCALTSPGETTLSRNIKLSMRQLHGFVSRVFCGKLPPILMPRGLVADV